MDYREPRSCAGRAVGAPTERPARSRTAWRARSRWLVHLGLLAFARGGTRDPATPPHPKRHPCGRGAGLRRPGHCPPGTASPPDCSDAGAARAPSPTGRARVTSLGVGCDPHLHHDQCRGFRDPRLGSGSTFAPPPPAAIRRWHLTSSAVLVVYLVVHVSRRWKRIRRSTIR